MPKFPDSEKLCAQILREAGLASPPVDLEAISSLWPNLQVYEEDLDKEGYLIFLGAQGAEMLIRKGDPPNRKRFTIAHELGHWVLSNMQDGELTFGEAFRLASSTHRTKYTPEETWCNEFAGHLLMPTSEVRRYFHGDSGGVPSRLAAGPQVFHVSEEAFFSRVADVLGWVIVELFHGQDLHRVGRRFIRRAERRSSIDQFIDELLRKTSREVPFPRSCIRMANSIAYGIPRTATKQASAYLVCIVPEDSSSALM